MLRSDIKHATLYLEDQELHYTYNFELSTLFVYGKNALRLYSGTILYILYINATNNKDKYPKYKVIKIA